MSDLTTGEPTPGEIEEQPEVDTGPPPPEPPEIDAEQIDLLLDVVIKSAQLPSIRVLGDVALQQLTKMAKETQEKIDEANKEYQAAVAEWEAQQKAEAEAKRKAEEEEKADAA